MILLLKNVRLSFPSLFVPTARNPTDTKRYSATFLIPKTDTANLELINAAIKKVAVEGFKDKAQFVMKKIDGTDRQMLKDGDEKFTEDGEPYQGYGGCYYIKGSNTAAPKVIDRHKRDLSAGDGLPYAGSYVNVQLDIWAQNNTHGKFINCKLLAVQHWEDGDHFGATVNADLDQFDSAPDTEAFDADEDKPW